MEKCINERAIDVLESLSTVCDSPIDYDVLESLSTVCDPPIDYESQDESDNLQDVLSDIGNEMLPGNDKVTNHLQDFSEIFQALADEDFANEDSRKRFLAAQLQMLEQFGLGASDISNSSRSVDTDLDSEGIASGSNPSRSTQTNVLNYMFMGSHPEHALHTLTDMRAQRVSFRDVSSDFGEEEEEDDEDVFFRVQMELIRRLGLLDEDGVLPYADMRSEQECQVCFDMVRLSVRQCCQQAVCDACVQQYVETQLVDYGNLQIGCPNPDCDSRVYTDEVRNLLRSKPELRERYDRWIVDLNGDPNRKTCPRCCHITEVKSSVLTGRKVAKNGVKIECVECQLEWCFPCQSPWHEGMTCRKFRTGDVLLKNWAREHIRHGECNAQRCPKCKVSFVSIISQFAMVIYYIYVHCFYLQVEIHYC